MDDRILAGLAAQAAPRHETYSIRSFVGPVPEEFAEPYAELDAAIVTDAPMGDIDLKPAVADVREVRENEALMQRQRRTRYTTLALAAEGTVVAYTDLLMPDEDPGAVFQSGTLVRREHRGHRLGLAVKVANLRFLQAQRDDGRILTTYNAEINDHIVESQRGDGVPARRTAGGVPEAAPVRLHGPARFGGTPTSKELR